MKGIKEGTKKEQNDYIQTSKSKRTQEERRK
jgi:hypothetical protein